MSHNFQPGSTRHPATIVRCATQRRTTRFRMRTLPGLHSVVTIHRTASHTALPTNRQRQRRPNEQKNRHTRGICKSQDVRPKHVLHWPKRQQQPRHSTWNNFFRVWIKFKQVCTAATRSVRNTYARMLAWTHPNRHHCDRHRSVKLMVRQLYAIGTVRLRSERNRHRT